MDKKKLRLFADMPSKILQNSYIDADFLYISFIPQHFFLCGINHNRHENGL